MTAHCGLEMSALEYAGKEYLKCLACGWAEWMQRPFQVVKRERAIKRLTDDARTDSFRNFLGNARKDIGDLSFATLKKYFWDEGSTGANFVFPIDTSGILQRCAVR